jgi:hypothetical protein
MQVSGYVALGRDRGSCPGAAIHGKHKATFVEHPRGSGEGIKSAFAVRHGPIKKLALICLASFCQDRRHESSLMWPNIRKLRAETPARRQCHSAS